MSDCRHQYSDDARLYRFLQIEGFYADKALEYVMAGLSIDNATLMANNLKCAAHKNAEMYGLCTPNQNVLFKARSFPNAPPAPSPPSSPPPTPRKGAVFDSAIIKCGPIKASQPPPSPPLSPPPQTLHTSPMATSLRVDDADDMCWKPAKKVRINAAVGTGLPCGQSSYYDTLRRRRQKKRLNRLYNDEEKESLSSASNSNDSGSGDDYEKVSIFRSTKSASASSQHNASENWSMEPEKVHVNSHNDDCDGLDSDASDFKSKTDALSSSGQSSNVQQTMQFPNKKKVDADFSVVSVLAMLASLSPRLSRCSGEIIA